jgi:hypothetical protein
LKVEQEQLLALLAQFVLLFVEQPFAHNYYFSLQINLNESQKHYERLREFKKEMI